MNTKINIAALALIAASSAFAQFTPGKLVVTQVSSSAALTGAAAITSLIQVDPVAGSTPSTVVTFPSSGSGTRLVNAGSASAELFLSFNDGRFALAGYNADAGTATIATSTSAAAPRTVAIVNLDGTHTLYPFTDTSYSGGGIRSAVIQGTDVWTGGTATGTNGGTRYFSTTAPGTGVQLATAPTNVRGVDIIDGVLHFSAQTGTNTFVGINRFDTALPTAAGATATRLPGLTDVPSGTGNASPYQYVITGNTMYFGDDRSIANGGGIMKFTLSGGNWTYQYTMNGGLTSGVRGLTLINAGPVVKLAGISAAATSVIFTVEDTGAASAFTTVATAPVNTAWRGLRYLPATGATFNGTITLNSSDSDWSNEQVSFEFVQNGNSVATVSGVQLSASGAYTFNAPGVVTPGAYDIRVKGDTWLSRLAGSVSVANGSNTFSITLTRNGDVNGDNEVGAADFSQLAAAYDSVTGDVNFDALADVNDDGEVGAADFSIIAANYDEVGE